MCDRRIKYNSRFILHSSTHSFVAAFSLKTTQFNVKSRHLCEIYYILLYCIWVQKMLDWSLRQHICVISLYIANPSYRTTITQSNIENSTKTISNFELQFIKDICWDMYLPKSLSKNQKLNLHQVKSMHNNIFTIQKAMLRNYVRFEAITLVIFMDFQN